MSAHHQKLAVCPNCGTSLKPDDNFCPHCGQENHEIKLPLGHIAYEFVESITHFDNKLWNTLKAIFTRPGQMTAEFLEGKRARYVPPARLYVFVSVIFFFLVAKYSDRSLDQSAKTIGDLESGKITVPLQLSLGEWVKDDSLLKARGLEEVAKIDLETQSDKPAMAAMVRRLRSLSDTQLDSLLSTDDLARTPENREKLRRTIALLPDQPTLTVSLNTGFMKVNFDNDSLRQVFQQRMKSLSDKGVDSMIVAMNGTPNRWNRLMLRQGSKLLSADDKETQHALMHKIYKYISMVMFVMMPLVAVLLLAFYYRRRHYYYEHLIFSVHIHTVIFLFFILFLSIAYFLKPEAAESVVNVGVLISWVYFLVALKRVYRQSWPKTTLKFLLLSVTYSIVAGIFLLGATLAGIFTF